MPNQRSLFADVHGAQYIEYLFILCLVGLAAIGAWELLGGSIEARTREVAIVLGGRAPEPERGTMAASTFGVAPIGGSSMALSAHEERDAEGDEGGGSPPIVPVDGVYEEAPEDDAAAVESATAAASCGETEGSGGLDWSGDAVHEQSASWQPAEWSDWQSSPDGVVRARPLVDSDGVVRAVEIEHRGADEDAPLGSAVHYCSAEGCAEDGSNVVRTEETLAGEDHARVVTLYDERGFLARRADVDGDGVMDAEFRRVDEAALPSFVADAIATLEESERPNLVIAVDSNMDGTPEEYWLARDGEPVGVVVAPADADPGADRSAPVVEPPREDDDLGVIGTIELMGKLGWLGVNIAWDEAKEELEDLWPF